MTRPKPDALVGFKNQIEINAEKESAIFLGASIYQSAQLHCGRDVTRLQQGWL